MFSSEIYGYNKQEVEKYISQLNTNHERTLMNEKLKVLETEKKILEIKKNVEEREKNILRVLESYKKAQNEGSKNLEALRTEQLKMIYIQLQTFLQDLNAKVPGVLLNSNYKKLMHDIETVLESATSRRDEYLSAGTENDPIRILLSKMQGKKSQENPKEVRIERAISFKEKPSQIKPVTEMKLDDNDDYDNLVDKFLNSQPPEPQPKSLKIQSSGFDLKEAINPKQDLNEIMKAFDFYSDNNEEN